MDLTFRTHPFIRTWTKARILATVTVYLDLKTKLFRACGKRVIVELMLYWLAGDSLSSVLDWIAVPLTLRDWTAMLALALT